MEPPFRLGEVLPERLQRFPPLGQSSRRPCGDSGILSAARVDEAGAEGRELSRVDAPEETALGGFGQEQIELVGDGSQPAAGWRQLPPVEVLPFFERPKDGPKLADQATSLAAERTSELFDAFLRLAGTPQPPEMVIRLRAVRHRVGDPP